MVALQIQAAELREARNGQAVAEIKQAEIGRAEPSSETSPTSNGKINPKGVPSVFTLEGMPS